VHINAGDCWKHIVVRRPRDLKIPYIFRPKSLLHPNAGDAVVRMVIRTPEDVPALAFRRALDAPKACALTKRLPTPQDSVNRGTLTGTGDSEKMLPLPKARPSAGRQGRGEMGLDRSERK
jgi:hypothetical protein